MRRLIYLTSMKMMKARMKTRGKMTTMIWMLKIERPYVRRCEEIHSLHC